jgi:hypothetical protein
MHAGDPTDRAPRTSSRLLAKDLSLPVAYRQQRKHAGDAKLQSSV